MLRTAIARNYPPLLYYLTSYSAPQPAERSLIGSYLPVVLVLQSMPHYCVGNRCRRFHCIKDAPYWHIPSMLCHLPILGIHPYDIPKGSAANNGPCLGSIDLGNKSIASYHNFQELVPTFTKSASLAPVRSDPACCERTIFPRACNL